MQIISVRERKLVDQIVRFVEGASEDWEPGRIAREIELRWGPSCGCSQCGVVQHDDGSRIAWKCSQCSRLICRSCTLTIPGRLPAEYYEQTLCGVECWHKAGEPEQ
jgi:hypothetical protein